MEGRFIGGGGWEGSVEKKRGVRREKKAQQTLDPKETSPPLTGGGGTSPLGKKKGAKGKR